MQLVLSMVLPGNRMAAAGTRRPALSTGNVLHKTICPSPPVLATIVRRSFRDPCAPDSRSSLVGPKHYLIHGKAPARMRIIKMHDKCNDLGRPARDDGGPRRYRILGCIAFRVVYTVCLHVDQPRPDRFFRPSWCAAWCILGK
jgi:hypothetical protein